MPPGRVVAREELDMEEERESTGREPETELERLRRRVRELEGSVRNSEAKAARLESLMRAAPLAIGIVDPNRTLLEVNGYLCRMLGYSRQELVGKNALVLYPSREEYDFVGEEKYRQIRAKGAGAVETRWRRKDGATIHVLLSSAYVDPSRPSAGTVFAALDITERKRAEEALREEWNQVISIFDSIDQVIYVSDPWTYEVLYVNRAVKELLGKDPCGGLCYKEFQNLESPCPFCTNPILLKNPLDPYVWEHHNPVLARDYLIVDKLIRWPDGRDVRFEFALDITERKRAEEALRESEEKYRLIVETAQEGIWAIDAEAVTTFVNPRMAEMLGYTVEEMLGKSLYRFMDEEERPRAGEYFERRRGGISETHDFVFRGRDGERVFANLKSSPTKDSEGGFGGAIAFVTDITEARRAQERRETLNRVFMRLGPEILDNIETILRGAEEIVACRLATYCLLVGERLSILTTVPGEEGFTVTPDKEGYLCYAFISDGARSPQVVPDLAGRPEIARDKLVEKHGLASFILYPVVVEGRTVGCLGCFDSRPREWTEEEIELVGMLAQAVSVEQERLDREEDLKDFIDVASHELRHPITVIKGYAQTMRELWEKLPPGKRRELLEAVEYGADRLERMVKELLDLSRIERGYFPLRREEVAVEPLLYAAAAELSNRGYLHTVNVVSSGGEAKMVADGDRLSLLLSVLLDNAAKYSPQGSAIDLEVREGDGGLLFSVMDRGIGVPDGERERIFERFYQVEDAAHHSFPGMGIGLYVARDIVEAHGGKIWCEAREGGGTIFRFVIPQGGREDEEKGWA